MSNDIEIRVRSRDESGPGVESADRRARGLRGTLQKVGETAAGFMAANVVGAGFEAFKGFVGGSVEAASNLTESLNAVTKVFGNQSDAILDWGKNNAVAYGLSQRAFNDLAVPLGAGLKNSGMAMQDVSKWTVDLTKRAADMASIFNTDVSDAMEAIQSGLRGEADPLERFGVGLSAAAVEAEALAETGKKTGKSLTDQEKMTARLNLIMKQTSSTQGDFTENSKEYANAERIAAARTEELQAKIGSKLIPVMLKVTQAKMKLVEVVSDKLMPAFDKISNWLGKNPAAMKALAIVAGVVLVVAFTAWAAAAASAAVATIAATWPILAIMAAIAGLAAAFVWCYKHSETFRKGADAMGKVIKENVWPAVKSFGEFIGKTLVAYLKFMVNAWLTVVGALLSGAAKAFGWIPGIGPKLKAASKEFNKFKDEVNAALNGINSTKTINIKALVNGKVQTIARAVGSSNDREDRSASFAAGGIVGGLRIGAAGGGPRSNLVEVGEHGRELVRLPFGSSVIPNGQTEAMLGGNGSAGRQIIEFRSSGSDVDNFLVEMMRKAVRKRGGNVQVVFG